MTESEDRVPRPAAPPRHHALGFEDRQGPGTPAAGAGRRPPTGAPAPPAVTRRGPELQDRDGSGSAGPAGSGSAGPAGSGSAPPRPAAPVRHPAGAGVPARPSPLPPPRAATARPDAPSPRPSAGPRPVARTRRARLAVKRVDPWSVFLYAVVASLFLGVALVVAVGVLYGVLSGLGVLSSVNTLIGDVTAEPGSSSGAGHFFTFGKTMTFAVLLAALNVVLLSALATLSALLYNLSAALTGGVELTLGEQS